MFGVCVTLCVLVQPDVVLALPQQIGQQHRSPHRTSVSSPRWCFVAFAGVAFAHVDPMLHCVASFMKPMCVEGVACRRILQVCIIGCRGAVGGWSVSKSMFLCLLHLALLPCPLPGHGTAYCPGLCVCVNGARPVRVWHWQGVWVWQCAWFRPSCPGSPVFIPLACRLRFADRPASWETGYFLHSWCVPQKGSRIVESHRARAFVSALAYVVWMGICCV